MHYLTALLRYYKTAAVALIIIVLCLIPGDEFARLDLDISMGDMLIHFIMFFVFSAALCFDIIKNTAYNKKSKWQIIVLVICIGAALGLLTELLQLTIKPLHRTGSITDFLADVAGAFTGSFLIPYIKQKFLPDW